MERAFFVLLRGVARVTGRSLSVSTIILLTILFAINFAIMKIGGRPVGPIASLVFCALLLFMLWRVSRIVKAYGNAFAARDFAEVTRLREIIEGKGEPKSKAMRALKRVGDGELLLQFEKWKEAADVFATIELEDLPEIARPGITSELGYARAHAGSVDKGVADIERALEMADAQRAYPAAKKFHLLRRHGIVLSLAGEHERAIAVLAPLREDFQGDKREWAEAFYFLGRSHAALDENELAGGAYAASVCGEGPFVGRAWKELEKIADPADLAALREEIAKQEDQKN